MTGLIDLEDGLGRVMGQKQLYFKMLRLFLEGPEYDRLRTYLDNRDIENARETSHAIKGAAGNLSLTALYRTNLSLLEALRAGQMPGQTQINAYDDALQQTRDAVRRLLET